MGFNGRGLVAGRGGYPLPSRLCRAQRQQPDFFAGVFLVAFFTVVFFFAVAFFTVAINFLLMGFGVEKRTYSPFITTIFRCQYDFL